MTSVKSMRSFFGLNRDLFCTVFSFAICILLTGCQGETLYTPEELTTAYPDNRIWAVAPFTNESGVARLDSARIADLFTHEAEQIDGIRTVPVNRVIATMQLLNLEMITSETDAVAVQNLLGVDGLIVGTVTAYDAYTPLKLGIAVQLFTREQLSNQPGFDPQEVSRSGVGALSPLKDGTISIAQASGVFDASNHSVRNNLHRYTKGRAKPDSALGTRIYDVSMELYTSFVSYQLIKDLLDVERQRILAVAME